MKKSNNGHFFIPNYPQCNALTGKRQQSSSRFPNSNDVIQALGTITKMCPNCVFELNITIMSEFKLFICWFFIVKIYFNVAVLQTRMYYLDIIAVRSIRLFAVCFSWRKESAFIVVRRVHVSSCWGRKI